MTNNDKHKERLWQEHYEHMLKNSKCQHPKPILVYPPQPLESHLSYTPRATLLHKCSDETGCCQFGEVCTVRDPVSIKLPFKVNICIVEFYLASYDYDYILI